MEEQDLTQISVLIAGRTYPLKIKKGDETTIRDIVKEVNEKINKFQLTYTKKDKQDCLAMALLTFAVDLHKAQQGPSQAPADLTEKIYQIEALLDQHLR